MPRRSPPSSPLWGLLGVLWHMPLWAVPFALFFGTIYGSGLRSYFPAYVVSLVFAYSIGLSLWVLESFLLRRIIGEAIEGRKEKFWLRGLSYAVASLVGSFAAATLVHFTLIPGFLGGPRQLAGIAMFTLIFTVLFGGLTYAIRFYRQSIEKARAEQELHLARRIQRSFLLSQFPEMPRLEVHAVNVSSKQVSGDFYDVVPAGERAFLLAIADVAGKGVPAALLSSMLQASLRTQANSTASVAAILRNINSLVYRSTAVEQFATFFLARIEEDTLRLSYSNAGHNFPIVFRRNGERLTLERGGTVVGILEGAAFEEASLLLSPGDRVVFYTDGINEAANARGELFGEERILDAVHRFLDGEEPGDDMTLMALRVLETAPEGPGSVPSGPRMDVPIDTR